MMKKKKKKTHEKTGITMTSLIYRLLILFRECSMLSSLDTDGQMTDYDKTSRPKVGIHQHILNVVVHVIFIDQ